MHLLNGSLRGLLGMGLRSRNLAQKLLTQTIKEELVGLEQLAEQASQCGSPEDLEIPAVLQKFF